MSTKPQPVATTSSVHVIITAMLGMIVTGLCCYVFYVFRTGSAREQAFTDAMKVIKAATEIVASMAERGLPSIRGRVDELESRGRILEQQQRKVVERLTNGGGSTSQEGGSTTVTATVQDEAALLAARRSARISQ